MTLEQKKIINQIDLEIRKLTEKYYPTNPSDLKLPRKIKLSPPIPIKVQNKIRRLELAKAQILRKK